MTQPADGAGQKLPSRQLRLYAEFGRKRGGLLYVLQAIIIAGQYFVTVAVADQPATLWRPVLLLPLFLAYFVLRTPVWRHFYRRQGDLDRVVDRAEARSGLRFALLFSAGLGFLLALGRGPVFGLAGALWLALPFVIVALWGRLPVDTLMCTFTGVTSNNLLLRQTMTTGTGTFWLLTALAVAVYGLYEHLLFIRSQRAAAQLP